MNTSYHLLFKFILVGDANVGKSSILSRFIEKKFLDNYQPTLGVEFGSKTFNLGSTIVKLMIWDTAGQETFKSIIRSYYKSAVVALLVYDITNRDSFINAARWLAEIQQNSHEVIRILLVGNKNDMHQKREVTQEEAQQFADKHGFLHLECSAKTNNNIETCFFSPSKQLIEDIEQKKIILNADNQCYGIKIGNPEKFKLENSVKENKKKKAEKNTCSC